MSVELCLATCWDHQYAGLENGDQCWCGDTFNPRNSSAVNETLCNVACPGNTTEYCGAKKTMLVYNLTRID
ncbi:uncharacterized protein SPSK_10950 [Sporothrix schenckii 1099-18]|nr:uncharacterized protein SPSK_10950 [Sporothrix schenckii 1099-18]KJR85009.1 hypothetical protein SPSK_10950 [Sporothrix schenckii 1099-18]